MVPLGSRPCLYNESGCTWQTPTCYHALLEVVIAVGDQSKECTFNLAVAREVERGGQGRIRGVQETAGLPRYLQLPPKRLVHLLFSQDRRGRPAASSPCHHNPGHNLCTPVPLQRAQYGRGHAEERLVQVQGGQFQECHGPGGARPGGTRSRIRRH